MTTGTVKFFDDKKGYGFISQEDASKDELFVHFSDIQMDGFKKLKRDQRVQFKIAKNDKGAHATNVEVIAND